MKTQLFFLVILAVSALRVQGGTWYNNRRWPTPPGQTKKEDPRPIPESSEDWSFSTEFPLDSDASQILSNRALGLWPPSLLTFLTRAGPWSMSIFQVYFLYLGDVDQLINFVNRLDTTFTVQQKCPLVVSSCSTGIRTAADSSDLIVQIFARSVSNVCCGTSYSIPSSSSTTTTPRPTSGCYAGGVYYQEGQAIPNSQACTTCVCRGGQALCYPVTCPALACSNPVRVTGQCCSQCPEPLRCVVNGLSYSEGQSVPSSSACSTCTCRSGQVSCTRPTCPQLQCSNPVYTTGACCPSCPEPLRCVVSGLSYSEGQSVPSTDACSTCTCRSGQVSCTRPTCPQLQCSNPVYTTGACCPSCPSQCAELGPQSRIVGGTVASQCEFPALVGIYRNGAFICGGSILDSTRVMTAAHCVTLGGSLEVHAGKYYTSRTTDIAQNPNLQISAVTRYISHPNFISNRLINDVAILHLATPLNMTSCVMPTCLPTAKDYDFSINCVVAGWGTTTYGGTTPTELRKVILPGYTTETCLSSFDRFYTANVVTGVICAALPQGGRDACQGDSGGIMLCPSRSGGYKQYGVVSSGSGCASPGSPGLYTDVANYLDWINSN